MALVSTPQLLQDAAQALQSGVADVLAASKPLSRHLQPLAAALVQSETRLLSRDVLLLSRASAARQRSLEVRRRRFYGSSRRVCWRETISGRSQSFVTLCVPGGFGAADAV